jgi:hypothetical protein
MGEEPEALQGKEATAAKPLRQSSVVKDIAPRGREIWLGIPPPSISWVT